MSTPEQIRDARERWDNCGRGDGSFFEEVEETLITLADAYCDGPDWHDRPTEKRGLWAVLGPNTNDFCTAPRHLTAHDIDIYIERGCRFFGPIPSDPKGT